MKKAIVVLFAVAMFSVDCAKHNRKHKDNHEDSPGDEDVDQWPDHDTVSNFGIPDIFTSGSFSFNSSKSDGDETSSSTPGKQHAKANKHRAH